MKTLLTTSFLLLTITVSAQEGKEEFLQEAAVYTCECYNDPDKLSAGIPADIAVGTCMIEFVTKDQNRYEALFGPLDFSDEDSLTELGESLGVAMLSECPDVMMKLVGAVTGEDDPLKVNTETITGELTKISTDEFVVLTVKEDGGRPVKLLWLDYFSGSEELLKKSAKKRKLTVSYETRDIYNGVTGEYVTWRVIVGVE